MGPPRVPARNCGTRGGRLRGRVADRLMSREEAGPRHPSPDRGDGWDQSSKVALQSDVAPSAMEYQASGTATTVASPTTVTLPFGESTASPLT